jgi:uncharacterized protein with PQ loop repeat
MTLHNSWHDPSLIKTIGHTAGVLLFGLIIVLLIRDWRTHEMRQINLSLIAATLAFGWNIGSLIVLASPNPGSRLIEIVMTASFSTLSLLPAVLLHVALQREHRPIVVAGYLISATAAALHFGELFSWGEGLHQASLIVIAGGFGLLIVIVFLFRQRQKGSVTRNSEWISPACLLLFATSFLHFGYQHTNSPCAAPIPGPVLVTNQQGRPPHGFPLAWSRHDCESICSEVFGHLSSCRREKFLFGMHRGSQFQNRLFAVFNTLPPKDHAGHPGLQCVSQIGKQN